MSNPNLLLLTIPGFLISAILLAMTAHHLYAMPRRIDLANVPLVEEQTVELEESGKVVLNVEAGMFALGPRDLRFTLLDPGTDREVRGRGTLGQVRGPGSSLTRLRVCRAIFTIEQPGKYLLKTTGLKSGKDYSDCRIVFTRPFLLSMILHMIGIFLFAVGTIVGLVFTTLILRDGFARSGT